ncbi:MAG: helix-turn-helix domain-containing protein [Halodesulfurarchaeum sp.]
MVDPADLDQTSLRDALERVDDTRAAMRLIAAIAYANGITQSELAEWFGVERKTIYNWFTRLDSDDLVDAVTDEQRPGRPRKLDSEQRAELERVLGEPPTEVGIDADTWTPQLVREFLRETFDVTYSIPSCRRLMREAGLTYRSGRGVADIPTEASDEEGDHERSARGVWTPE